MEGLAFGLCIFILITSLILVLISHREKGTPKTEKVPKENIYENNLIGLRKLNEVSPSKRKQLFLWAKKMVHAHIRLCKANDLLANETKLPCTKEQLMVAYKVLLVFGENPEPTQAALSKYYASIGRFQEIDDEVMHILSTTEYPGLRKDGNEHIVSRTENPDQDSKTAEIAAEEVTKTSELIRFHPVLDPYLARADRESQWLTNDLIEFMNALKTFKRFS